MIKVQDKINYPTLMERIDQFDKDSADLLNYLVGNIIYLKENGVNSQGIPNPFNLNKNDSVKDLLKTIFNAAIIVFMSDEVHNYFRPINNFFIYKGEYLIPMSAFFKNVIQILDNYKASDRNINQDTLGMVQVPSFSQFSSNTNNQGDYRENKLNLLKQAFTWRNYTNEAKYPSVLVDYGRERAKEVALGMTIKAFWYTWRISNIRSWIGNR